MTWSRWDTFSCIFCEEVCHGRTWRPRRNVRSTNESVRRRWPPRSRSCAKDLPVSEILKGNPDIYFYCLPVSETLRGRPDIYFYLLSASETSKENLDIYFYHLPATGNPEFIFLSPAGEWNFEGISPCLFFISCPQFPSSVTLHSSTHLDILGLDPYWLMQRIMLLFWT